MYTDQINQMFSHFGNTKQTTMETIETDYSEFMDWVADNFVKRDKGWINEKFPEGRTLGELYELWQNYEG